MSDLKNKPNIIFLMDDQHRWDALGCINPQVKTPHLDALIKSGVHFDQAVCQAPMCVPSRNSVMLGTYPNQNSVTRNSMGLDDDELQTPPLAEVLRAGGYQTAGFGKTHSGTRKQRPSTRGFETRYIGECFEEGAIMMKDAAPEAKEKYDAEIKPLGGGEENTLGYQGFTSKLPEEMHRDGWVSSKCLEFLEEGIDEEKPLFLYLSFLKPHAGHNVPKGYEDWYNERDIDYAKQPAWNEEISAHAKGNNRNETYEAYFKKASEQQWREMTMRYYANCSWIDDMFGRTLSSLEQKGLLENALIVYCSDHGEMLGERYYRFNKYCLYESSVRIPLVVSGSALPQELKQKKDHRPAELLDLYPTILECAGIVPPTKTRGLNLLSNKVRKGSFCALHETETAFMWRTQNHKLILVMAERKADASDYTEQDVTDGEFYDLNTDPREYDNLYHSDLKNSDVFQQMKSELLEFLQTQQCLSV